MSIIGSLIAKESARNQQMIDDYEKELDLLPKGTINKKKVGNKTYYYLCFRESKKVITKYIGSEEKKILVEEQLNRRAHIESMLKSLKNEQKQIKKIEGLL